MYKNSIQMNAFEVDSYKGLNIADHLQGMAKECYLFAWKWMEMAWGNNVEFQRLSEQILLCSETVDYLYGETPKSVKYIRGERPILEREVDEICKNAESDRDKVLAILVYIRDLHKKSGGADFFWGGTEEDLIKKGEGYCERVSRLMVSLCEIAGFPGRIVFHTATGHLTCEIFLEDKWAYFDPRYGMFCMDEKNRFLSVFEILNDRTAIYRQNDFVKSFILEGESTDFRQHYNYNYCFNPKELQRIGEYSLMDADKYNFNWVSSDYHGLPAETLKVHRRYVETGAMTLINITD